MTYDDGSRFVCPEYGHEWPPGGGTALPPTEMRVVRDANGAELKDADTVIVVKDLKIKGSSQVVKVGTKVKNIRLAEGGHDSEHCRIGSIGAMGLKSGVREEGLGRTPGRRCGPTKRPAQQPGAGHSSSKWPAAHQGAKGRPAIIFSPARPGAASNSSENPVASAASKGRVAEAHSARTRRRSAVCSMLHRRSRCPRPGRLVCRAQKRAALSSPARQRRQPHRRLERVDADLLTAHQGPGTRRSARVRRIRAGHRRPARGSGCCDVHDDLNPAALLCGRRRRASTVISASSSWPALRFDSARALSNLDIHRPSPSWRANPNSSQHCSACATRPAVFRAEPTSSSATSGSGARRNRRAASAACAGSRRLVVAPAKQAQMGESGTQGAHPCRGVGRRAVSFEHGQRQPVALLDAVPDPVSSKRRPGAYNCASTGPTLHQPSAAIRFSCSCLKQPIRCVVIRPAHVRFGAFCPADVVGRMRPSVLAFAALRAAAPWRTGTASEHADSGAGHRPARSNSTTSSDLSYQHGQKAQRFVFVRGRRDFGGSLERPAAREDGHQAQQALLGRR
ncbi:MAG: alkylphosphonate utilization protein, partial [Piscinibacter sp.]|nr:alkylphosphonate utilization protein [Piscinibacter sp.]